MPNAKRLLLVLAFLPAAILSFPGAVCADPPQSAAAIPAGRGPVDGLVLLIRHAEKPGSGPGLGAAGEKRAQAYVRYFGDFRLDGVPTRIHSLVAAADSDRSNRSRLTLAPLGRALGLPVQQPYTNEDVENFAGWLALAPKDETTLVAWHHGELPRLLACLGADPDALLPHGNWPDDVYDWVIALRFDGQGRLVSAERIVQPALPAPARLASSDAVAPAAAGIVRTGY